MAAAAAAAAASGFCRPALAAAQLAGPPLAPPSAALPPARAGRLASTHSLSRSPALRSGLGSRCFYSAPHQGGSRSSRPQEEGGLTNTGSSRLLNLAYPAPAFLPGHPHSRSLSSTPRGTSTDQSSTSAADPSQAGRDSASESSGNGAAAAEGAQALPLGEPELSPLKGLGKLGAQIKMFFAPPWARVKKGSVLHFKLGGRVTEQLVGFGGGGASLALPKILENLEKAAVDPRVSALSVRIDPLSLGWGKVDEIRRYITLFRKSGKPTVAYMQVVGEMEYYLASAFEEIYVPPSAYVSLRGLAVQGTYLRGVLEKAGVDPQVVRIGKYKSAGDQFARKDMSEANREMLTALLDDIYFNWIGAIAAARGKNVDEVQALLDSGVIKAEELEENGLISGLKYEAEVEHLLKVRTGQSDESKPLRRVEFRKYSRVGKGTLNLGGAKDATIAVLRATGGISQGKDRGMGGQVKSDSIIEKIRFVRENKLFKALVLRIDSPGGDALASDLMWHEIRELAKVKPVVASMSDVAASGGYYMAMAAPIIVAEHLTLTGSIGVVLAKFNLAPLYGRVGLTRELISKGKFAELNADYRPFTPEEEKFFEAGAESAYKSFRDKAAFSRNMEVDAMESVAQGRVWTGNQAVQRGLVDALGGFSRALAIAKEKAGIPKDKRPRIVELSVSAPSITALLSGARVLSQITGLEGPQAQRAALAELFLPALGLNFADQEASLMLSSPPGTHLAVMPEINVVGLSQLSQAGPLPGPTAEMVLGTESAAAGGLSTLQLLLFQGLNSLGAAAEGEQTK